MSRSRCLDDPVQVHVDEVQSRRRSPVTDEARLHVLLLQRLLEQGIVEEIRLTDGEIVRCSPPRVDLAKELGIERAIGSHRASGFVRLSHAYAATAAVMCRKGVVHARPPSTSVPV